MNKINKKFTFITWNL